MASAIRPDSGNSIGEQACRDLVTRILASREFRRATRQREFLLYVVDRQLVGRPDEITETLIGHRVYHRRSTWDSGNDSIVRTEAGTLRKRLERYFAVEGAGEPMVLEIPRGGYQPFFRPRQESPPAQPALAATRRQMIWLGGVTAAAGAGALIWRQTVAGSRDTAPAQSVASVELESSDTRLTVAFQQARNRALNCVYSGDPVGEWYATRPDGGSTVFCVRDVAHQSLGAAVLGLHRHTANMLRRFARSVARGRDWCCFWTITKDGVAGPESYPTAAKRGEDAGQSTDTDAYDLILKNKERLLSFAEPVRFIFSHSALREGWDNPNVFVMGMLKKSDNTVSRRQEIGRGLRLTVDQHGDRMDNPITVHDINQLTVVTDESYTDFVTKLQKEIAEALAARPRKASVKYFVGKTFTTDAGERVVEEGEANALYKYLVKNDYINDDDTIADAYKTARDEGTLAEPTFAVLKPIADFVWPLVDALYLDIPYPDDGRKPKRIPLNEENFTKKEFQELWRRINHKAVYQVEFDSTELIAKCVAALDANLNVTAMQYVVQSGQQVAGLDADDLAAGSGFAVSATTTHTETVTAGSQVVYDLLGEIAEKTQLTRSTARAILGKVKPTTFAKYRQNPEHFITEATRLINEQKATVIIEHLKYDTLAEQYDTAIFTENQTKQDFEKAGARLTKHIYDYVVTDSMVERDFVTELDTSTEVVVYAKLPRGFFIPTPVGDYNPDWAIAFQEGNVKHVYFVAETKGSLSSMQLKGAEVAKIDCARKFFASLNARPDNEVVYDAVTDYGKLMELVGAGTA